MESLWIISLNTIVSLIVTIAVVAGYLLILGAPVFGFFLGIGLVVHQAINSNSFSNFRPKNKNQIGSVNENRRPKKNYLWGKKRWVFGYQ